jgi:hypothetical protein
MKEYKSTGGVYVEGYQRCALPTTNNMSNNQIFEDNGYSPHHIYSMAAGKRKKHKDIISVEKIENLKKL